MFSQEHNEGQKSNQHQRESHENDERHQTPPRLETPSPREERHIDVTTFWTRGVIQSER